MTESKIAEVRRRLWAAWQMREKTGEDVVADLSDLDLSNANFQWLNDIKAFADVAGRWHDEKEVQSFCDCLERGLRGISFAGMDLSRSKMTGMDLRGCDFTGAKLPRSIVRAATDGARFDPTQEKQMAKWAMQEMVQMHQMPMQ